MSSVYRLPAGSITLTAYNVDDGAAISLDGDKRGTSTPVRAPTMSTP